MLKQARVLGDYERSRPRCLLLDSYLLRTLRQPGEMRFAPPLAHHVSERQGVVGIVGDGTVRGVADFEQLNGCVLPVDE